jgi:probable HAF family extracellular repeat protein
MKKTTYILVLGFLLGLPVATAQLAGQETRPQYHHYSLRDVGTFGGPDSWMSNPAVVRLGLLNNQGTLTGEAETSAIDPYCYWSAGDCYATSAFRWKNGGTSDLGVLPGGIGSAVNWIGPNGLMVGIGDNGQQDPLNPALPQIHAVVWQGRAMTDLGTFMGGYDTWALSVNSRGEIVGEAYNKIPDANSMFGYGYQSRAFYWNHGVVQDLGTLGTGNDAAAGLINERGQVIAVSYTSSTPDSFCTIYGFSLFTFTTGSFLWDRESGMKDIGSLGGACTLANDLNNQGQVVGVASLPSDTQAHAFVWDAATGITDLLDPSDSSFGYAAAENAHGDITGQICNAVICNAVLWRKRDGHWKTTILGTTAQITFGWSINASEQVVGDLYLANGTAAFLADGDGPVVDLNTLIPPGSGLQLYEADQVNDLGEISVQGADANGNNHVVLLIPCDDRHPGVEGCDYSLVDADSATSTRSIQFRPAASANRGGSAFRNLRNTKARQYGSRLVP